MHISSEHKKIIIYDEPWIGKKYLHLLFFKEETLVFSDFTESVSEFELTKDGFYTVVSYIIDKDEIEDVEAVVDKYEILDSVNVLCLCYLEDCVGKLSLEVIKSMKTKCEDDKYKNLKSKRDFIFVTYSALKYMGELNKFHEAQRMLEDLSNQCNCNCK